MWPWGHLAAAYLLLTVLTRAEGRRPGRGELLAVALGSQLPDLIDKPLAWTLGVLPNGRSLAHSLLLAALVTGAVLAVYRRRGSVVPAVAFAIGYVSHLLTDALYPAVTGAYADLAFLGWPIVPPVEYATEKSFAAHFAAFELTWFAALQFVLVGLAVAVWLRDGRPGVRAGDDVLEPTNSP